MKKLKVALLLSSIALAAVLIKDYQKRMVEYNAHVCAVYGYQDDCKTPLKGGL